jgi:hypothetical protein
MKIAFRTSGGRGEYEIAGSQGNIKAKDLALFTIDYQVSPNVFVPGKCYLKIQNEKPRIRLSKDLDKTKTHIQRWLSAILWLPEPTRVRKKSKDISEDETDIHSTFSGVDVDIISSKNQHCVLRPTILEIRHGEVSEFISIPERLGRIQYVLENINCFSDKVQSALILFADEIVHPDSHTELEKRRNEIYKSIGEFYYLQGEATDALPVLEEVIASQSPALTKPESPIITPIPHNEDDSRSEIERQSDYVRTWRLIAERGYQAKKFSQNVVDAYDYRCLVSGARLPKVGANNIPGVDAAHILPWAKYNLNTVQNGLCLSKTFHWAFDTGIIQIIFDYDEKCYITKIDEKIKLQLNSVKCDVFLFQECLGAIPKTRLPENQSLWPNPDHLNQLNALLTG